MSGRSDDELADLLEDLERDLDRLTDRLDADDETAAHPGERGSRRRRAPGRRRSSDSGAEPDLDPDSRPDRGPRPPSPGDLLRFTEEYTIPTVISVLEATIQSLELVRGGLRLADPTRRGDTGGSDGRRRERTRDRAGVRGRVARELGGGASTALDRTLSDLRAALSAADLPEDGDAREILEDARSLTDEIERRLDESDRARRGDAGGRADADPDRSGRTDRDGRGRRDRRPRGSGRRGVGIEVHDADDERDGSDGGDGRDDRDAEASAADDEDDAPQVDVDAELDSIRREVDEEQGDRNASDDDDETRGGEGDGDGDGSA